MNARNERPTWIRIEAPDADAALGLERRLAHLHASAVARHGAWSVEVEDLDDGLEEIEAVVRHWLRATGAPAATVHVDDAARTVRIRARHEHEARLGEGYDAGVVLEHEP